MADFIIFIGQQWILVSILLVLLIVFVRSETARGGALISTHQLTTLVNRESALILDIRDSADYKDGHIVDAIHIPFAKIKERVAELETHKEKPIIIVDKMGQHSGPVGKQLREAGFNITRLEGGMTEWRGSNLPVVKE